MSVQTIEDCPQVALASTNQDGESSIKAYESGKSHGKIEHCEQSITLAKKAISRNAVTQRYLPLEEGVG